MNRILQENIFKRRGATTVMHYPSFQDVYRSAPICPASGVFQSFPQPFRMGFDANMVFHPSYQKIGTMAKDPVVDGVIVGKADGRYARSQSLLGLVLARVGKERFIAPFYADAKARAGYVDRKIATKTDAGSLSELGLKDAINNIRESERIGGTVINTALVAIPILAGCFAVAEQVGITDLVRYLTGMKKSPRPACSLPGRCLDKPPQAQERVRGQLPQPCAPRHARKRTKTNRTKEIITSGTSACSSSPPRSVRGRRVPCGQPLSRAACPPLSADGSGR